MDFVETLKIVTMGQMKGFKAIKKIGDDKGLKPTNPDSIIINEINTAFKILYPNWKDFLDLFFYSIIVKIESMGSEHGFSDAEYTKLRAALASVANIMEKFDYKFPKKEDDKHE